MSGGTITTPIPPQQPFGPGKLTVLADAENREVIIVVPTPAAGYLDRVFSFSMAPEEALTFSAILATKATGVRATLTRGTVGYYIEALDDKGACVEGRVMELDGPTGNENIKEWAKENMCWDVASGVRVTSLRITGPFPMTRDRSIKL